MEQLLLLLGRALRWLLPPAADAEGHLVRRWRVTVVVVTMTNSAVTGTFIALALGAVPVLFGGFAPAKVVDDLRAKNGLVQRDQEAQLAQLQENQLDSKILDTRTRQCRAIDERKKGNELAEQAVQFATVRLQEQLDDFWNLTKRVYRLPACSEV